MPVGYLVIGVPKSPFAGIEKRSSERFFLDNSPVLGR